MPCRTRLARQRWQRRLIGAALLIVIAGPPACARRAVDATPAVTSTVEPAPITVGRAPDADEYAQPFDARHYDIRLTVPASGSDITGITEVTLGVTGRADTLTLDFTGLAVAGVRVDDAPATFRHDGGKLRIPLRPGVAPGRELRVSVEYSGVPDDGLIIRNTVHGQRAVFADNWPNRARFWFPAIDHPADKATAAFTVDAPATWQVVANGVPHADDAPAGPRGDDTLRRWRWTIEQPISTYNMVIGATEFDVRVLGTPCVADRRCVDVTTWLFPQSAAAAGGSFRRGVQMVEYYSSLVAPFPYGKLAHVQSATRFGGMENATAIFYDEQALAKGRDIEATVAHETAHQWFGNAVTAADWPDLWLSEGFATYFATLFFEHADGLGRLRERMENDRARIVKSDTIGRPIADSSNDDLFARLNTNTYQKAGWVLHMLRGIVGDEAFFAGIRRYYRDHEHRTATTADLRRAMEGAARRDLGWFFEQWLFEPGFPRLRATARWDAAAREAVITIEQTQPVSWPTFRIPLTVQVRTGATSVRQTIEVNERREVVRMPVASAPDGLALDPDGWVLKEVESQSVY